MRFSDKFSLSHYLKPADLPTTPFRATISGDPRPLRSIADRPQPAHQGRARWRRSIHRRRAPAARDRRRDAMTSTSREVVVLSE